MKEREIRGSVRLGYWLFGTTFVIGVAQVAFPWMALLGWATTIYGFMVAIGIGGDQGQRGCFFFAVLAYGLVFGFQFGLQSAKGHPEHWVAVFMCSVSVLGVALLDFMARLASSEFDAEAVHAGNAVAVAIEEDSSDDDADNWY